jgi:hypothetical protein
VDMDLDFCPWTFITGLAIVDNRDPGDPGATVTFGTSRPPLCLCLTERLEYLRGDAVADRDGGTVCGLDAACLSDAEVTDALLGDPPLSGQP